MNDYDDDDWSLTWRGVKRLIGRTISEVWVYDYMDERGFAGDDGEKEDYLPYEGAIMFVTDQGPFQYNCDGDCCSETWFSDIIGFDALIGSPVMSVEPLKMNFDIPEHSSRQDYDSIYGIKIVTQKGHCDIMFRNSSNGYYGGDCSPAEFKGLRGFKQITEDWGA